MSIFHQKVLLITGGTGSFGNAVNEYNTPRELRAGINDYMTMYNTYRPHDLLSGDVPHNVYYRISTPKVA